MSAMTSKDLSVAVVVSDATKSAQWYKEKLGFASSGAGHWVTVGPEGATWKLHLCQGQVEPGNTGIAIYCDNLETKVKQLKSVNVKFTRDFTKGSTSAMFEDLDGNIIWLKQGSP